MKNDITNILEPQKPVIYSSVTGANLPAIELSYLRFYEKPHSFSCQDQRLVIRNLSMSPQR